MREAAQLARMEELLPRWDDVPMHALREPGAHSVSAGRGGTGPHGGEIRDWTPQFLDLDPVHGAKVLYNG